MNGLMNLNKARANPLLRKENSLRNVNVENLEEININALEREVKAKGIGNRGSPTYSLTENINTLPVKPKWKYNPLTKKNMKKKGGKRRQTRKQRKH